MATKAIKYEIEITDDDQRAIEKITDGKISVEDWIYSAMVAKLEQARAY